MTVDNTQYSPISHAPAPSDAKSRVRFIDTAKGIGIILVVWYHIGISPGLALNLFFMPLFFFMSGLFFNPRYEPSVFFRKKVRGLLGPLALGVIIGIPVEIFINGLVNYHDSIAWGFYNFGLVGNVPIWFLLTLFYVVSVAYAVERYVRSKALRISLYAVLSAAGFALSLLGCQNTLFLGHALLVLPFFLIGYLWRDYWLSLKWHSLAVLSVSVAVFGVIYLCKLAETNIHRFSFSPWYLPSFLAAMAGVFAVLWLSVVLSRYAISRWLIWIGESTVFILILHDLFVPSIQRFFEAFIPAKAYITYPLSFAVAVGLCVVCIYIGQLLKRRLPMFF